MIIFVKNINTEEKYTCHSIVIGELSSIVNEAIRTISRLLIIFFYEKILSVKKAPKCKITNFPLLRCSFAQKIVAFAAFCSLVFVLLVGFGLIYIFVRLKFFRKKK